MSNQIAAPHTTVHSQRDPSHAIPYTLPCHTLSNSHPHRTDLSWSAPVELAEVMAQISKSLSRPANWNKESSIVSHIHGNMRDDGFIQSLSSPYGVRQLITECVCFHHGCYLFLVICFLLFIVTNNVTIFAIFSGTCIS
jgi:hypothetical protein